MNRNSIYKDDTFLTIEVPHRMPVIAKSYADEETALRVEIDAACERFDDFHFECIDESWEELALHQQWERLAERLGSDCHSFLWMDRAEAAWRREEITKKSSQNLPHQWVGILGALNEFLGEEEEVK